MLDLMAEIPGPMRLSADLQPPEKKLPWAAWGEPG